MTEHEQQAEELQERSDKLGEDIAEARKDWDAKKHDPDFPGAITQERSEELPPPEPDETD
jgi:hypothetical protein